MLLSILTLYFGLLIFLIVFLIINLCAFYNYLLLSSITYTIDQKKLTVSSGVFSLTENYLELYRVLDMNLFSPFLGRMLDYSLLTIYSNDVSSPVLKLKGVPMGVQTVDFLRKQIEEARKDSRIFETL